MCSRHCQLMCTKCLLNGLYCAPLKSASPEVVFSPPPPHGNTDYILYVVLWSFTSDTSKINYHPDELGPSRKIKKKLLQFLTGAFSLEAPFYEHISAGQIWLPGVLTTRYLVLNLASRSGDFISPDASVWCQAVEVLTPTLKAKTRWPKDIRKDPHFSDEGI